jgi:hypothetical protein
MTDDVLAAFLPRFKSIARDRVARARVLAATGKTDALALELHQLTGEASVMGLVELADLVRAAHPRTARTEDDWGALFDRIARAVEDA